MNDPYKTALRSTMKDVRANTSVQFRLTASHIICEKIKTLEPYRKAKHIALYCATRGEVELNVLWNTAPLHGKFCYFPVVTEHLTLSFLPATPNTAFKMNRFGILEPDVNTEDAIDPEALDLIIMPIVNFDTQCMRLGMGQGYYDRTLANKKNGMLIGVAYQFQHMDYIEQQPWDVPLNAVITEQNTYWRV